MVQASGSSALARAGSHANVGQPSHQSTANNATRQGTMTAPSATFRGRAKPTSQLRSTPSTSSLRSKSSMSNMTTGSSSATTTSASTSTTSLSTSSSSAVTIPMLSVLPTPDFTLADVNEAPHFSAPHALARLLQLVDMYDASRPNAAHWTGDVRSACLYARLALSLDATCVMARRVLAHALLHGATLFPFGPGQGISTATTSISRAGAHAAIETLRAGSDEILLDVGCARIYSQACSVLGRWKEAGEVLERSLAEETTPSESKQDSLKAPTRPESILSMTQSQTLTEASHLFLRTDNHAEAKAHLYTAHQKDAYNWSAWVAMCDLGCIEAEAMRFGGSQALDVHQPQSFYARHLEQVLRTEGYDEAVISKVGLDLIAKGKGYFSAAVASSSAGDGRGAASKANTVDMTRARSNTGAAAGEPMARTASKRTVAQAIAPSPTPSSSSANTVRPGSRSDAPKRMRTMPASTTVKAPPPGRMAVTARGVNANNSAVQNAANNVAGVRQRALAPPSASLTHVSARMAGTLSASRTNTQARSDGEVDNRGQTHDDGDEMLKGSPRRSARTNNVGPATEEKQTASGAAISPNKPQRTMISVSRRPVAPRPASRLVQPQTSATGEKKFVGNVNGQAAKTFSTASTSSSSGTTVTKPFHNIVQRAAAGAVREAALWNMADAYIVDLLTSLSQAYNAVRSGQCRLALALLRPKGPLSSADELTLRKETALVYLPFAIEDGEETDRKASPPSTIQIFAGLPSEQRSCVEVQGLLGRAYHSLSLYHLAEKIFQHARRLSPSSINNMDIYSLTLFHLQREVELNQLARELSHLDPAHCISHIAAGNKYSLQKEHTFALHSFQRACRACPTHAYAFTLAGYEAGELGEREKSLQFFSEAIKIDKRHWNAYAGFGQIHLQEQKIQAAAYYYGRALDLHRTNAILWDVYGRVKMAQGHLSDAEKAFTLAIRLDDRSAMSHVKLAEVLLSRASVERQANVAQAYRDRAHEHLVRAVHIAPDEAHIHLMLAKSYMEKGHGHFATLLQHGRSNAADSMAVDGYRKEPQEVDMVELAVIGSVGAGTLLTQQQQQIRATGRANLPTHHRAEIARHLSTAIDLNPRLARYVKAMGEGARASLRGAAARLTGDMADGSTMFEASLLPDESTEGGVTDSMIDMDDEHVRADDLDGVLEDAASDAATEVMLSETGMAEEEDFDGQDTESTEEGGHADQDMDDSSQELAEAEIGGEGDSRSRHGLGLSFSDSERHSELRHHRDADEQDVSMSF